MPQGLNPKLIGEVAERAARDVRAALEAVRLPATAAETPQALTEALAEVRGAVSQPAVLRALMRAVARFGARAAVFVPRGAKLEGWEGVGFEDDPAVAAGLRGVVLSREQAALATVFEERRAVNAEVGGPFPVPEFGQTIRGEALLAPLLVQEKVAGVVYADPAGGPVDFDRTAARLIVDYAGLAVERLVLARMVQPSAQPAPAAHAAPQPVPAAHAAPQPAPRPAAAPEPATNATVRLAAPTAGGFRFGGPAPAEERTAPEPRPAVRPVAPPGEPERPHAAPRPAPEEERPQYAPRPVAPIEPPPVAPRPAAIPVSPAEPAPVVHHAAAPIEPPPIAPRPIAPVEAPVAAPRPAGSPARAGDAASILAALNDNAADPEAEAADARRYARLLMDEIMLYHGAAVEEGRAARDIRDRLADEINQARQMYERRVDARVRGAGDYFEEALVQIIAGGDAGALGPA